MRKDVCLCGHDKADHATGPHRTRWVCEHPDCAGFVCEDYKPRPRADKAGERLFAEIATGKYGGVSGEGHMTVVYGVGPEVWGDDMILVVFGAARLENLPTGYLGYRVVYKKGGPYTGDAVS